MRAVLRRFAVCATLVAALTFTAAGSALLASRMEQMLTGRAQTQVRLLTEDGRWRFVTE